MQSTSETVYYRDASVAMIFPAELTIDGVFHPTDANNPLQIGLHNRPKGITVAAHLHSNTKPLVISDIQEFLYIVSGSIRLTLLSIHGDFIAERILKTGDSVLLMREAHEVEYLEETRMIEVKQGPYSTVKTFIKKK